MAILFSQADGSDQRYDTYEEFEQAFILLKRLNGEKVPQDLVDEVKAKNGDKGAKPIRVEIDGTKVAEAIRKATEELSEALDKTAKDRTPISDECENPGKAPKLEIGDKVRVISAEDGTDSGYHGFRLGSTVEVKEVYGNGKVDAYDGIFYQTLLPHHYEKEDAEEVSPTEFRTGDIVKVTETFADDLGDRTVSGNVYEYDENLGFGEPFVGIVYLGDNLDKLQLACRREDRKDIEL